MRITVGTKFTPLSLETVDGRRVHVPDEGGVAHLQLRRFAGCPVCNLHLQSFAFRSAELEAAGIREVVVFHSPAAELRKHTSGLPFPIVADPDRVLYTALGVGSSWRAILDPRAWPAIVASVWLTLVGRWPAPGVFPHGGRWGLPADFLVAPDGRVLACKYGVHADDQWSVDEVLALAEERPRSEVTDGRRLVPSEAPVPTLR